MKTIAKKIAKFGVDIFKLHIDRPFQSYDRGIHIFGYNISRLRYTNTYRGMIALEKCIKLAPKTVLDVGSGGGEHAKLFANANAEVTCIDFGNSIYAVNAKNNKSEKIEVIYTDFLKWNPNKQYDLVWASHVLEHQRNVGLFIEKLIESCNIDGHIAISVPFPHRNLWGGHLTVWTPGLLAYNCVMCGLDISDAILLYGKSETSMIFKPIKIELPELSYDSGDLLKLKPFLPKGFTENSDSWF